MTLSKKHGKDRSHAAHRAADSVVPIVRKGMVFEIEWELAEATDLCPLPAVARDWLMGGKRDQRRGRRGKLQWELSAFRVARPDRSIGAGGAANGSARR